MREPVISLHVQGRSPDGNGVEGVSEDAVCGGLAFVAARAPEDDDDDAPAVARRREGDGRAGGPRVAGLESVAARDGARVAFRVVTAGKKVVVGGEGELFPVPRRHGARGGRRKAERPVGLDERAAELRDMILELDGTLPAAASTKTTKTAKPSRKPRTAKKG